MKEFSQLLKDYMQAYEHDTEMLAEAIGLPVRETQSILDGVTVPTEAYVLELIKVYHLEQQERNTFYTSWQKTRLKYIEKCNKMERQLHALSELPTLKMTEDTTLSERIIFVLVASQYFYNTVHSTEAACEEGQEIIAMRNLIVYNYGSNECKEALEKLSGDDFMRYVEAVKRRVLP